MMSSTKTADESRNEAIHAMGEDLGKIYHALSTELFWLYLKWNEYVVLYGTKPSRIDLMNRAAAGYFGLMKDVMWEDMLIHIARMTDSPESIGKPNLTIRQLTRRIPNDSVFGEQFDQLIAIAVEKAAFARDWRNKRIAHRDLERAISDKAVPLTPSSRAKIREALQALSDVMNAISQFYLNSTTGYEFMHNTSGSEALLRVLDGGLRYRELVNEKIRNGEYRTGDITRDL